MVSNRSWSIFSNYIPFFRVLNAFIFTEQLIKNYKNISNNEPIDPLLNEQITSKVTYSNPQIIQNNVPNVNEAQLDLDHIYTEQNGTNISHNRG